MSIEEISDHVPLCPLCEGVLQKATKTKGGWKCPCGEFIPKGCEIPPRLEEATGCGALAEMAKHNPHQD